MDTSRACAGVRPARRVLDLRRGDHGFGRLGTWFAAQHYGVTPDFLTFAKAVTSGYQPLGGVFVGRAPLAALQSDPAFFMRHATPTAVTPACARPG